MPMACSPLDLLVVGVVRKTKLLLVRMILIRWHMSLVDGDGVDHCRAFISWFDDNVIPVSQRPKGLAFLW